MLMSVEVDPGGVGNGDPLVCMCLTFRRPAADPYVRRARRLRKPYADFASVMLLRGIAPFYLRLTGKWTWAHVVDRHTAGTPWERLWQALRCKGEFDAPEQAYAAAAEVWAGVSARDKWLIFRVVR